MANAYKRAADLYKHYIAQVDDDIYAIADEITDDLVDTAKARCPVETGALMNSIHKEIKKEASRVVVDIIADASNPVTGECYGDFVEYGTGIHRETGDGRKDAWSYKDAKGVWHTTKGQAPQPFMRPAIQQHTARLEKRLKALVLEDRR
ncbi:MAG: HK97 gp10 family phage protein [Paludibacteraceae bacterium]|nr:HK97 gp10 family phage protein [Paludibacteraceae bacterium]MBQ7439116.1 HK97 gp10 family phage protein [Paludibacteraceae bacterium]